MQKKISPLLLVMFCCALLTGCTTKSDTTPEMTSNGTRIKELQSEYHTQSDKVVLEDQKYSYENNQLKINLK